MILDLTARVVFYFFGMLAMLVIVDALRMFFVSIVSYLSWRYRNRKKRSE